MNRRPRLFLVYADSVFAAACSRHFRRLGWDVRMAAAREDVVRSVAALAPTAVVLDSNLPNQDRSRIASQINQTNPGLAVVLSEELLTDAATDERSRGTVLDGLVERLQTASAI